MKTPFDMRNKTFTLSPVLFILPWILVFGAFWMYPIVYSFMLSFTNHSLVEPDKTAWIGLQNYHDLYSDPVFLVSIKNTFLYCVVTIPVTIVLAILIANNIHRTRKGELIFRTALFLPSVISVTVLALIFIQFYAPQGYLHRFIQWIGFLGQSRGLLLEEQTALWAIMVMDIFIGTGYYSILFAAAIKNVPVDLYESADISGASEGQKLRYITLPLIRPMILFSVVIGTIKGLQVFTEIYIMTKGGPLRSSTTMIYYVYELAFKNFEMGYASAAAYVLLFITGILAWMQFRLLRTA